MVRFELSADRQIKGQEGVGQTNVWMLSIHTVLPWYYWAFFSLSHMHALATMTQEILSIIQCQPI